MIFYRGQMMRRVQLRAVRDVGGAFPQAADHTPAVSHGAHRLGNHAAGGDASPPRARRAYSLTLHAGPVLFTLPPPSGRPLGMQVTRSQEGPNRGHGKSPAAIATGRVLQHAAPGAGRATSLCCRRLLKRLSASARTRAIATGF